MFKASRLFVRLNDKRLQLLGLGVGQIPVVVALGKWGSLTQKDLATISDVEQPTMAALLNRMERHGLIERTPDSNDRRSRHVSLTQTGTRAFPEVERVLQETNERAYAGFSSEERAHFVAMLQRMIANLEEEVRASELESGP